MRKIIIISIFILLVIMIFCPEPKSKKAEFKNMDIFKIIKVQRVLNAAGIKAKILSIEYNRIFCSVIVMVNEDFLTREFESESKALTVSLRDALNNSWPFNIWLVCGKKQLMLAGNVVYDSKTANTAIQSY